jgi:hypothetical protein
VSSLLAAAAQAHPWDETMPDNVGVYLQNRMLRAESQSVYPDRQSFTRPFPIERLHPIPLRWAQSL